MRILHQANTLFAPNHIEFRSLYLDPEIICSALGAPVCSRYQQGMHKALLYAVLQGIMPETMFRRPDKGEHSPSLYQAWEQSKQTLLSSLAGGILDEEGLISMPVIRRESSFPMPRITFLFDMQRLAAVERWLGHAI